jgi:hypothetical protein
LGYRKQTAEMMAALIVTTDVGTFVTARARRGAIALLEHAAATWDGEVTILECAFQAGEGDPTHQAACDLPGMVAEVPRGLSGEAQS